MEKITRINENIEIMLGSHDCHAGGTPLTRIPEGNQNSSSFSGDSS